MTVRLRDLVPSIEIGTIDGVCSGGGDCNMCDVDRIHCTPETVVVRDLRLHSMADVREFVQTSTEPVLATVRNWDGRRKVVLCGQRPAALATINCFVDWATERGYAAVGTDKRQGRAWAYVS